jgi:hypothetical protein
MSMEPRSSEPERRSGKRVVKRLPVRVRNSHGSAEVTAHTRDVSSNGVFLYTQTRVVEGSEVELVLILPPELTAGKKCWVCCHAQVLRVESQGPQFGVAAKIQRIDVLPEVSI